MPHFSSISLERLDTVHEDLQRLAHAVIKRRDCTVLAGKRNEIDQNQVFALGYSKAQYGESPHNVTPSYAIDLAPYPIRWDRWQDWVDFSAIVLKEAEKLGLDIVWGGTFKMRDGPHYELKGWRDVAKKQFPDVWK